MKTIAVIDGNSLMHRAFHAVPTYMTAPDGRPTNACFGFIQMLLKLIEELAPNGIVCAFDAGIPAFRFEAIELYKAQRPPTDPDLKAQFPMIQELLTAMSIPVVRVEGWEGDDILGTVATQAEQAGIRALLVTGDKDALQLASETTAIVNTKTGMSEVVIYDPAGVYERFGVTPERVPDFLGLMGDSSDNIPGVPGVGPKTATKLLQQYGTLEEVIAHAGELKGKLAQNIAHNVDQAYASKKVATIVRDVPFELDLEAVRFPSFDPQAVKEAFGAVSLMAQLRKILALGAKGAASRGTETKGETKQDAHLASPPSFDAPSLTLAPLLTKTAARDALAAAIGANTPLALHIEVAEDASLFDASRRLCIATQNNILIFPEEELAAVLRTVVESGTLVAFDTKALLQEVIPRNSSEPALVDPAAIDPARIFDLQIAAYLLDSSRTRRDLTALMLTILPALDTTAPEGVEPGAYQAAVALQLHTALAAALATDDSKQCFERIEMPLIPVLVRMERLGMNVDTTVLRDLSHSLTQTIDGLRAQAVEAAGEEFNLDSPKQLGAILFEKLKLPTLKKTRTGYSTDAAVLQELAAAPSSHPLPGLMLEYRELAKLKSTYLDALPSLVASDGHIHTSFNQAVAATGRLSSSDPNLQNIPVRTSLGRQIRTAFVPDPSVFAGKSAVFLGADYSQIELRLLAHLSGDEGLIEAFLSGEDFHAQTAARVFGMPADAVTPQLRSRAKAVNFGIVYGQQAYGLSQSLGVSFQEAQDMIKRYFAAYPQVRHYLDETVEQARRDGFVTTLFGRKRHIHEITSGNANMRAFGERTAMNHPMQGSAADIIKLAMIEVQRRLAAEGLTSQMVLQVHDELDFNCATHEVEQLSALVKDAMEKVVALRVPLTVDISTGPNWAEAH
ncbi:MAG: DNA polymerase I [Coriobacteriales bacterium]|jgi:DNA polymerase-1|nr:DNA polymerase I [Coriobacteriales bacterium]